MKKLIIFILLCILAVTFSYGQGSGQDLKIFKLKHIQAGTIKDILENLKSKDGKLSIDANTNTIIITDSSDYLERISKVINELDVAPRQVEVNVTIIEAKDSFLRRVGIENSQIILPDSEFVAILNLAQTSQDARIKSKSKIRTLSNQAARIQVTQDVLVDQEIVVTDQAISSTPIRKPVGSFLEVLPVVNNDNTITLNVGPKLTSVEGDIQERSLYTQVTVNNNDTIILGGLDSSIENSSQQNVPVFDIPLQDTKTSQSKQVIVFLTTKIIE